MNRSTVVAIAGNELRRLVTDRSLLLFAVLLPVTIITIVGSAFGTRGSIDLGVADSDRSPQSEALIQRWRDTESVDLSFHDSVSDLRRDVRTGAVNAGVVVPSGYGVALDGGDAEIEVLTAPGSQTTGAALAAIDGAVSQAGTSAAVEALIVAQGAPEPAAVAAVDAATAAVAPTEVTETGSGADEPAFGSFDYTAPSNLVLFVFVNTFAVGTVLASDRKLGLIARLVTTPNTAGSIVGGLGLARLAFALGQSALIVVIGSLLFGVRWGDPLAALVLVTVFAAVATASGLLAGALVSDADQAQAIGIPVAIALGMLGGCMWPLEIVPDVMRQVGHVTPHAWAMDAWMALVFDGAGIGGVLPEVAVLTGFAVVLGVLAARRLHASVVS